MEPLTQSLHLWDGLAAGLGTGSDNKDGSIDEARAKFQAGEGLIYRLPCAVISRTFLCFDAITR
jgi:hypothetical protein